MSVAVINARAVGNEAHFNGRASAVVGLVVEGAAVVWRAAAHIAIVVHDRSCTEFEARSIRRGIVVSMMSITAALPEQLEPANSW